MPTHGDNGITMTGLTAPAAASCSGVSGRFLSRQGAFIFREGVRPCPLLLIGAAALAASSK
jgi:hypothetical protein